MTRSTCPRRVARALGLLAALALGDHLANAQSASGPAGLTVLGEEPSYLDLGAGVFDVPVHRGAVTTGEGRIEFRYGEKLFYIGLTLGVLVNGKVVSTAMAASIATSRSLASW